MWRTTAGANLVYLHLIYGPRVCGVSMTYDVPTAQFLSPPSESTSAQNRTGRGNANRQGSAIADTGPGRVPPRSDITRVKWWPHR